MVANYLDLRNMDSRSASGKIDRDHKFSAAIMFQELCKGIESIQFASTGLMGRNHCKWPELVITTASDCNHGEENEELLILFRFEEVLQRCTEFYDVWALKSGSGHH
jgi:hypothetical protein